MTTGQELAGKGAIVTGGASGLGRGTVELFVEEGANVVVADVDVAGGEELAKQLGPGDAGRIGAGLVEPRESSRWR